MSTDKVKETEGSGFGAASCSPFLNGVLIALKNHRGELADDYIVNPYYIGTEENAAFMRGYHRVTSMLEEENSEINRN